jgi:hypothetical protein
MPITGRAVATSTNQCKSLGLTLNIIPTYSGILHPPVPVAFLRQEKHSTSRWTPQGNAPTPDLPLAAVVGYLE